MNIYDFADIIDKEIVITRHPNQDNRFSASFEQCEITQGVILASIYGIGGTPDEAIKDLVSKIKGKRLVFNAMTDKRIEYVYPDKGE